MATGALRTNFADKRNMPQTRVKDTFFDYLLERLLEISSRVWRGQAGIFGTTSLVSGGNDRFSVSGPFSVFAIDGDGNIIELTTTYGELVFFENENAVVYSVGVRHTLIPAGVVRNPRIGGVIFYDTDEDMIGERAEPISVSESAGTLTIDVDSVCEVGVSNAGRSVTAWMKRPRTIEEAVAIERNLTVAFVGGKNVVVTSGLLGQGSPASTDVSEYQVALQGLTVKRNTDLSVTVPYAFVGTVTGGGAGNPPSGFGVAGQIDVSDGINPDLQTAYLAGRTITPGPAAGGAVKIEASTVGGDLRALLEISRKGAVESSPQNVVVVTKPLDGTALVSLLPLQVLPELQEDEAGTAAAIGTVDLIRVGRDLVVGGVDLDLDLVRLWDFAPTSGMNRYYRIFSFTSTQLLLSELDGSPVAGPWGVGESGNVGIHRVRLASGEKNALGLLPAASAPLTLVGQPTLDEDRTLLRLYPEGATHSAEFMDSDGDAITRLTRDGVVHVVPNGSTNDPLDALVRLRRFGNSTDAQFSLVAEMGGIGSIPIACVQPVENGTDLQDSEPCTLAAAGDTVTLTRAGPAPDLTEVSGRVNPKIHLAFVYDADDDADNGLYLLSNVAATTFDTINTDGSTPVFVGGVAKVRILVPRFMQASSEPFGGVGGELLNGLTLVLRDGAKNPAHLRILTEGGKIFIYDQSKVGAATVLDSREMLEVDPAAVGVANRYPFQFRRGMIVRGGDVSGGGGEEPFYSRDGVRIWNAGGLVSDRDPAFPLCVDAGFPEDVPTFHTLPAVAFDEWGAINRGHNFRDDFCGYDPLINWTNVYPQPPRYKTFFVGAGTVRPRDMSIHQRYGHGAIELETGAAAMNVSELYTPGIFCNLDTAKDFRWTFRAVLKLGTLVDIVTRVGLTRGTGNEKYYFSFNPTSGFWELHYWDGGTLQAIGLGGIAAVVDEYQWFQIRIISSTLVAWAIESKSHAVGSFGSGVVAVASLNGNSNGVGPDCWVQTQAAVAKAAILDYWEIFDREILYARHGTSHNLNHP